MLKPILYNTIVHCNYKKLDHLATNNKQRGSCIYEVVWKLKKECLEKGLFHLIIRFCNNLFYQFLYVLFSLFIKQCKNITNNY